MPDTKTTHVRYLIVLMLFIASTFSYGDRVVLSIAGVALTRDLHLDALRMGYLFSGFSWAYVVAQLPAGGLLDRFGSKHVYGVSIVCWSICALRLRRRHPRRSRLGQAAARRANAEFCAQDSDRDWHVAVDDDDRLQLR